MKYLFVFIISLLLSSLVFAAEHDATLTWDYDNPPTDLAGFELRINGDNSTIITLALDQRAWADTLNLKDDENSFELRAKDWGGQVSGWSNVYHDPVPGDPHITCITFQSR